MAAFTTSNAPGRLSWYNRNLSALVRHTTGDETDAHNTTLTTDTSLVDPGGGGPTDLLPYSRYGTYSPATSRAADLTSAELPPTITRKRPGSTTRFMSGPWYES